MTRYRLLQALLTLGVALIPTAVTFAFIYGYADARLTDFIPHYFPLDDLFYWRQIDTFHAVGFNGGYFATDERAAPAAWSHFGAHGPLYPAIYGTIASLTGWEPYYPVLFNLGFLTLALLGAMWALRLDTRQLIFAGLLTATSWPVLFYVLSGMQESLHQSLALGFVVLFAVMIRRGPDLAWWVKALLLVLIAALSLIRMTWVFLALPFLLLSLRRVTPRAVIGALAGTVLLTLVVIGLTGGYLYSPYHANFMYELQSSVSDSLADDGPLAALETGLDLVGRNIRHNLDFFTDGVTLEIGQRFQFVALIAAFGVWAGWLYRRPSSPDSDRRTDTVLAWFSVYNLAAILLINLVLYLMAAWRDYRVLAPHLLLTAWLLLAFGRYRWVALIIATNLLMIVPFKDQYIAYGRVYLSYDRASSTEFEDATGEYLVYDPDAPSAWCNTLLINYHLSFQPALIGMDSGIGVSYFTVPQELELPIKSRYVLLKQRHYRVLSEVAHLEHLTSTSLGELYLNRDADCGG
jgi:hypothetical protein